MHIMTKKEKEERKRIALIEEQKEKELTARISVKRTLASMKKSCDKLNSFKEEYIEKARNAAKIGNKQSLQLAKSGLKLCLSKQRFLESMISNFELSLQINDMNKVVGEFVDGINIISEQMKGVTTTMDMAKAQLAYEKALENNSSQFEALDAFLSTAADSIDSMDGIADSISDSEIDQLIDNQVMDQESDIDSEIDQRINEVRAKLNS